LRVLQNRKGVSDFHVCVITHRPSQLAALVLDVGLLDGSETTGIKFKITMKLAVIALLSCPASLVASNLPFGKWSSAPGKASINRQVTLSGRDGLILRNLGMGTS
jgi:hypothetical protein